jgi:hypothetical protein
MSEYSLTHPIAPIFPYFYLLGSTDVFHTWRIVIGNRITEEEVSDIGIEL